MLRHGFRHPARVIPLAFFGAIMVGTALLMLPVSLADGVAADGLTALFTATSAVCVTGLAVVDTPTHWSTFGQVVIMALFQLGGFGMMTGATLLSLLVAGRLRLGTRLMAQAETRSVGLGNVTELLRLVVLLTVAVEASLAAVLAARLHFGYGEPWGSAAWHGLFHSISAFNNAGFSTWSDSLTRFATDPVVLLPVMGAIVLGGLGFPVLQELRRQPLRWGRWSVHTKITLLGTAILFAGGMLMIVVYEWHFTLAGLGTGGKLLAAAFHSVSARTAGFNVVDVGAMQQETLAVHYVLMFIGGGSAGTAGGIKVTTFLLLGFVVWAEVRGSRDTTAFRRRMSPETQRQALSVVLLGLTVLAIATLALESVTDQPLNILMFEVISAFATVGLSTGITGSLPPAGQGILIVLMYVGRVGTITVATALALRSHHLSYRYPEERPIVG